MEKYEDLFYRIQIERYTDSFFIKVTITRHLLHLGEVFHQQWVFEKIMRKPYNGTLWDNAEAFAQAKCRFIIEFPNISGYYAH